MSDFSAGALAGAGAILILQFCLICWKMKDWTPPQR